MSNDPCRGPDWCPYDADVVRELVSSTAVQAEQITRIEKNVDRITSAIVGNGKEGLAVRTDRLEQKDKSRSRFFWIAVTAMVGLALKAAAEAFGFFSGG